MMRMACNEKADTIVEGVVCAASHLNQLSLVVVHWSAALGSRVCSRFNHNLGRARSSPWSHRASSLPWPASI